MFELLKNPVFKNLNGLFKRTIWYSKNMQTCLAIMIRNIFWSNFGRKAQWDWPSYVHAWQKNPMKDNLAFGLHVVLDLFNQDNTFPSEWPSFKENKAKWDITESLLAKST